MDLYRLHTMQDADYEAFGLEQTFTNGISLIEWPERLGCYTPSCRVEVQIADVDQPTAATDPETEEEDEDDNQPRWVSMKIIGNVANASRFSKVF